MSYPHWRTVFASTVRRRPKVILTSLTRYSRPYSVEPPWSSGVVAKTKTFAKYAGLFCISSAIGIVTLGAGILAHDALTYNEKHIDRVPVNPLALDPKRGGPKNLPIAHVLVDDEEDDETKALLAKPKLVIVGGGWGVRFDFNSSGLLGGSS